MIKRIITFCILCLAISTLPAQAYEPSQVCAQPYDLSNVGTRVLFNMTGITPLSQAIAQSIVKKELKKATGEKFKVKMKSYSAKDLASGRFTLLDISGRNLDIDGIYFSSINAKTLCDFNYVELNKNSIKFKENMLMDYSIAISDADLRKTMITSDYLAVLGMLNFKALGLNFFEIKDIDVKLYDGKFYFIVKTMNSFLKTAFPVTIVISAKLKVNDGKIILSQLELENFGQKLNMNKLTDVLNLINPLTFSLDILDNKDTKMQVKTVDIIGNHLIVDGEIFVPKNVVKKNN